MKTYIKKLPAKHKASETITSNVKNVEDDAKDSPPDPPYLLSTYPRSNVAKFWNNGNTKRSGIRISTMFTETPSSPHKNRPNTDSPNKNI